MTIFIILSLQHVHMLPLLYLSLKDYREVLSQHTYQESDMNSRARGREGGGLETERDQEGQCGAGLRKNN